MGGNNGQTQTTKKTNLAGLSTTIATTTSMSDVAVTEGQEVTTVEGIRIISLEVNIEVDIVEIEVIINIEIKKKVGMILSILNLKTKMMPANRATFKCFRETEEVTNIEEMTMVEEAIQIISSRTTTMGLIRFIEILNNSLQTSSSLPTMISNKLTSSNTIATITKM
jgi:hypothetical protein